MCGLDGNRVGQHVAQHPGPLVILHFIEIPHGRMASDGSVLRAQPSGQEMREILRKMQDAIHFFEHFGTGFLKPQGLEPGV